MHWLFLERIFILGEGGSLSSQFHGFNQQDEFRLNYCQEQNNSLVPRGNQWHRTTRNMCKIT